MSKKIYQCTTNQDAERLVKYLNKKGYNWQSGDKVTVKTIMEWKGQYSSIFIFVYSKNQFRGNKKDCVAFSNILSTPKLIEPIPIDSYKELNKLAFQSSI